MRPSAFFNSVFSPILKAVELNPRALWLLALVLFLSSNSWARKTDFTEPHRGLMQGGGTYFFPLPNDNVYDPVPELLPNGTEATGTGTTRFYGGHMGYFQQSPDLGFEVYGRLLLNVGSAWNSTGDQAGSGSSSYRGYGLGAKVILPLLNKGFFMAGVAASAEYLLNTVTLAWTPTGGTKETLVLSTQSVLAGLGLQTEVWLGDMWVLSLFGGYQYGLLRDWKVAKAGSLFGEAYTAGALVNPITGGAIRSQFGGILVEASFKLNF